MKSEATRAAYTNVRPEIVGMIDRPPRRVLDVGCSNGALGRYLKETGEDVWVAGIDGDPDFVAEARMHLDLALHMDLDAIDPEQLPRDVDLLVLADVLEHTVNPDAVLARLLSCTTPDAEIVVSLPNAQHWTAIKNLLIGHWPRNDSGLFDRTHLHLYTRSNMKDLVHDAGLVEVAFKRVYRLIDRPGALVNYLSKAMHFLPLRPWFTYIMVMRLRRAGS
ncbi:MAG: class I SAM-dependent methyltransferase [Pseudomonadales bacterium]|nr:class I SAM-dependent methyltransferase [Pseudomonadales bacterium]